jgi:hypothetical protein
MEPRHTKAAVGLLVLGLFIHVARAQFDGGDDEVRYVLLSVARHLAIGLPVMLAACVITAKVMGISFGSLPSAVVKLSAIYVLPGAVLMALSGHVPWYVGPLVALFLFCTLLTRLFELDGIEPLVCGLLMWLITLSLLWFTAGR